MTTRVDRRTVDLNGYPDLVVIYLGMRVNEFRGLGTLLRIGPKIQKAVAERPDGLLLHEDFIVSLFPPHMGMRQYWRDFDSLERWARTLPHQAWWRDFLRDSGGTGFWHEAYFMRGGMEAVYDDMKSPLGMMRFANVEPATGPMFSARSRVRRPEDASAEPAVPERTLHAHDASGGKRGE